MPMPARRNPFSYDATGGTAMPMTGTGTSGDGTGAYTNALDPNQQPGAMPMESPASLRRRIMPIAGPMAKEPDMLSAVQQMLQQRQGGM